jgi:hypothetical protein
MTLDLVNAEDNRISNLSMENIGIAGGECKYISFESCHLQKSFRLISDHDDGIESHHREHATLWARSEPGTKKYCMI